MQTLEQQIDMAAAWIAQAEALVITAGAGMGVDSGLPDFRGTDGFWRAYPALAHQKIGFEDIANPAAFTESPRLAWGFYGHRLRLYRQIVPHQGFTILRDIGARMPHGAFVFTSNVDGQFQKAGFNASAIEECHGSIHHLQCLAACTGRIWPAADLHIEVDAATGLLTSPPPTCPDCGGLARPNVLMFNDSTWLSARTDLQHHRMTNWLRTAGRLVVIELGAGTAIPSARSKSQSLRAPLVRINPTAPQVSGPLAVGIQAGALATLERIQARLD